MGYDIINLALGVLQSVSLLVIVSLGLAVIFGVMGIINFAHGEFLMLGAFMTLALTKAGVPLVPSMVGASLAVGAFGVIVELLLIRHLYGRPEAAMLATFGLSLVLVQVAVLVWGTTTQGLATPLGSLRVGPYSISAYQLTVVGAAAGLLALVYLIFTRTRFGLRARAASEIPEMAAAIGIDTRRTAMTGFGLGAGLAGAGGALLAPIAAVVPGMGGGYLAQAFMTVVVGGPGVFTGTAGAASALGGVERLGTDATNAAFGTVLMLLVAIVLLRVLPTGISGRLGRDL